MGAVAPIEGLVQKLYNRRWNVMEREITKEGNIIMDIANYCALTKVVG